MQKAANRPEKKRGQCYFENKQLGPFLMLVVIRITK